MLMTRCLDHCASQFPPFCTQMSPKGCLSKTGHSEFSGRGSWPLQTPHPTGRLSGVTAAPLPPAAHWSPPEETPFGSHEVGPGLASCSALHPAAAADTGSPMEKMPTEDGGSRLRHSGGTFFPGAVGRSSFSGKGSQLGCRCSGSDADWKPHNWGFYSPSF